jgi:hypothetical protein
MISMGGGRVFPDQFAKTIIEVSIAVPGNIRRNAMIQAWNVATSLQHEGNLGTHILPDEIPIQRNVLLHAIKKLYPQIAQRVQYLVQQLRVVIEQE